MTLRVFVGQKTCANWMSWAALSLGCMSGCASWDQVAQNVAHPWRATGDLMARASEGVETLSEKTSKPTSHAGNLPAQQLANNAGRTSPANKATVVPASRQVPAPTQPLTPAPANVELLPAPPVSPTSGINDFAPAVTQAAPASTPITAPANTTWCRIRVRNIGHQPVTQVAVTVSSPANAPLVSKEGDSVSNPTQGKMEFAPVPEVRANEEVVLLVGVATSDERANRLRVQVRDAQGGTNQELQARWQIAIEALD